MQPISRSALTVNYPLVSLLEELVPGSPGDNWARIKLHLPASTDLRSRSGKFSTPWNAVSPYHQPLPDLTRAESRSWSDLMDSRAAEIVSNARRLGRRLLIMWSGGLDSTGVLTAILKATPANEQADLITVCLTPDSIMENFHFYRKFVSGRLQIIHKVTIDITDEFLEKYLVINGDTADHLFFFGGLAFRQRFPQDIWMAPYQDNIDKILSPSAEPDNPHSWRWFYGQVIDNMQESKLDQLTTVGDVFYWMQLNFMWEGTNLRVFHTPSMRKDFRRPISPEHVRQYLDSSFYSIDAFQRWSYTHHEQQRSQPYSNVAFKRVLRDYILEFDGNRSYHQYKQKIVSMTFDQINDVRWDPHARPVYFDENWVGYTLGDPGVKSMIMRCLEEFEG